MENFPTTYDTTFTQLVPNSFAKDESIINQHAEQYFPTCFTCFPKLHPTLGRYFPLITHEQYFSQKCPFISVAHPIKMVV